MKRSAGTLTTPNHPGLCATCRHGHRIETARGSIFWRCRRSEADPAYLRYPRLPVLVCRGHEPAS